MTGEPGVDLAPPDSAGPAHFLPLGWLSILRTVPPPILYWLDLKQALLRAGVTSRRENANFMVDILWVSRAKSKLCSYLKQHLFSVVAFQTSTSHEVKSQGMEDGT